MGVFMLTRIDNLEFKTIDLSKDHEITVEFRKDSFVMSFGNADLFYWLCEFILFEKRKKRSWICSSFGSIYQ